MEEVVTVLVGGTITSSKELLRFNETCVEGMLAEEPGSAIYGMPILEVHKAHTLFHHAARH